MQIVYRKLDQKDLNGGGGGGGVEAIELIEVKRSRVCISIEITLQIAILFF